MSFFLWTALAGVAQAQAPVNVLSFQGGCEINFFQKPASEFNKQHLELQLGYTRRGVGVSA